MDEFSLGGRYPLVERNFWLALGYADKVGLESVQELQALLVEFVSLNSNHENLRVGAREYLKESC